MATLSGKWTFNDTLVSTIDATLNFTFKDTTGVEHTANNIFYDGNQATYRTSDNLYLVYSNGKWSNKCYQKIRVAEGEENATVLAWFEKNAIEDKYETLHRGIAGKIDILKTIKADIKEALEEKGADLTNDFTTYADKIRNLSSAKQVENISLDDDGILTWDAPEIFDLTEAEIIGYIVDVNGTTLETTEQSIDVWRSLITGDNNISVVAVINFQNEAKENIFSYVKTTKFIFTTLDATLTVGVYPRLSIANDEIYILGGKKSFDGLPNLTIEKFLLNTNEVKTLSPNFNGYFEQWTILPNVYFDNKIYYFANKYGYFDLMTNKKEHLNTTDLYKTYHALLKDDYVYIVAYGEIYRYDFQSKTFTLLITFSYVNETTVQLIGDNIYFFGGMKVNETGHTNKIYRYNITNNELIELSVNFPNKITGLFSCVINNKIYLFGGHYTKTIYSNIYMFDPTIETLTELPAKLPEGIYATDCVYYNGKIYYFAGAVNTGSSGYTHAIRTIEILE